MQVPKSLKHEILSFLVKCSYCEKYWNKLNSIFTYYRIEFNIDLGGLGLHLVIPKKKSCKSCGMRVKRYILKSGILDLKYKWLNTNNSYYRIEKTGLVPLITSNL